MKVAGQFEGFHVYGGSAALKFEVVLNQAQEAVLAVDGAGRKGSSEKFDWSEKLTLQFTPREMPAFMCCVLGITPTFEARNHGAAGDKGLTLVNQPERGVLYLRLLQQRVSINVPITADKVFHLGALGIRVLATQVHLDVPTCLAMLRGTAGRLLIAAAGG